MSFFLEPILTKFSACRQMLQEVVIGKVLGGFFNRKKVNFSLMWFLAIFWVTEMFVVIHFISVNHFLLLPSDDQRACGICEGFHFI